MNINQSCKIFSSSPASLARMKKKDKYLMRKTTLSIFEEKRHQIREKVASVSFGLWMILYRKLTKVFREMYTIITFTVVFCILTKSHEYFHKRICSLTMKI